MCACAHNRAPIPHHRPHAHAARAPSDCAESVVEHDEVSLRARLSGLPAAEAVELLEHIYTWDGKAIEILDDGSVWNHSASPNTGNHPDEGKGDGVSSYALRDIEVGEELTDDYAVHARLPWFENLCRDVGATSCISVGAAAPEP